MSSAKIGRPTDKPKNTTIQVRINEETLTQLDECVKETKTNRSEVVRKGISKVYGEIKK